MKIKQEISSVSSSADMSDHLRSAASLALAGVPPPAASVYCLSVLSRRDPNPPHRVGASLHTNPYVYRYR